MKTIAYSIHKLVFCEFLRCFLLKKQSKLPSMNCTEQFLSTVTGKKITRLSPCLMTSLESRLEKWRPLYIFLSLQSDKQSQNSYKVLNSKEIYNIRMWSIHYPKYFHTSFIHRTRSNPFRTITLPLVSQRWTSESVVHVHERNSRLERMRRSAKRAKPLTFRKDKERPSGITRNAGVIL